MSRYKVASAWGDDNPVYAPFVVQFADAYDTKTGDVFVGGASRVVVDGKPARLGKGGTVPYWGEGAWLNAIRLAYDLQLADRRDRYTAREVVS